MNELDRGRRHTLLGAAALAACAGLGGALPAMAQTRAPEEGTDYRAVKPQQPVEAPAGKIEVVEFFWYGCPHCNQLDPILNDWSKKLPADVSLRKVHVPFREVKHQQLYYTLETLGRAEELGPKVFAAIHVDRNSLLSAESQAAFAEKHGIERKKFVDTFNSFAVQTKMKRASQLAEGYGLDGVPAFGVAGKYYTAPSMAGSNAAALKLVEALVDRERKARR